MNREDTADEIGHGTLTKTFSKNSYEEFCNFENTVSRVPNGR